MGAQVLEHGHSGALACVVGAPGGVWARAGTGTLTGGRGCGYNRALGAGVCCSVKRSAGARACAVASIGAQEHGRALERAASVRAGVREHAVVSGAATGALERTSERLDVRLRCN
ncbi:hypothetical protein CRG98_027401 [Punica granatum]|uniref:Uncharacterized protein n=1 Tax=Punica granatum TaxID=22663 RepID=A0A2I0J949_PUNGR|nr:hypothetical protein CRG98_027401 [Punica granatum]